MPGGGRQPGAGRPKGALSKVTAKAKQAAMETGLLPHEWLLKVSRGEGIVHKRWVVKYDKRGKELSRELVEEEIYTDFTTRLDAAKAAAPFYAPKLAAQSVTLTDDPKTLVETLKTLAGALPV
jgi:hypothetical protein